MEHFYGFTLFALMKVTNSSEAHFQLLIALGACMMQTACE